MTADYDRSANDFAAHMKFLNKRLLSASTLREKYVTPIQPTQQTT